MRYFLQECVDLVNVAGPSCSTESDTMSLIYDRSSRQLPTVEQTTAVISRLRASAQPTKACCNDLKPFVDSKCVCKKQFQDILPIGTSSLCEEEGLFSKSSSVSLRNKRSIAGTHKLLSVTQEAFHQSTLKVQHAY